MNKTLIITLSIFVLFIISIIAGRFMFYDFVDNYEFAYMFDARTGETSALLKKDGKFKQGYIFSYPIVQKVHKFDTRPIQICIEGGGSIDMKSRVLNCKLVSFDPKGLKTFIEWHGRGDYGPNELENILMVYAYDPSDTKYPFLKISKDGKDTYNQTVESDTTKNSIR